MADTTDTTTPGDAPGVLMTGADGSLPGDLGARRAWVWMQDTPDGGGGRFDVLATRVDVWLRKGAKVVPNYPIHHGPSGRTAKPAGNLGGRGAGEPDGRELEAPPADTTGERQTDAAPSPGDGDNTDQADGNTAAADTTTRKGGRSR